MSKFTRSIPSHKRKIANDPEKGQRLLERHPRYLGNPQHKKNPGNFGLTPPAAPRCQKTLCDIVGIFSRELAQDLLCAGLRKGLFSEQSRDGWPCNIWAQLDNRLVLEARLDSAQGTYHGFPI
ncbi:MAG: hypothetical protein J5846_10570 [Desulfovibrio sp.]|nr:hypothetical protein [Desulfovibrio sp.]